MDTRREIADANRIIKILSGSRLYGTFNEDSDYDYIGVFVEPAEYVFSDRKIETAPLHNRGSQEKTAAGDQDGQQYSLRHFLKLALDGNPSILTAFFAGPEFWDESDLAGKALMELAPLVVSMKAAPRFKGYMKNQLDRLTGIRTGHIPNRPELVEKYGYDCYSDDTEFLTFNGWKYYDEITIDDQLATIDPDTAQLTFQNYTDRVDKTVKTEMIHIESYDSDILVTKNHRMLVRGRYAKEWQFKPCENLKINAHRFRNSLINLAADNQNVTDSYLSLLGAYASEGCVGKRLKTGAASVLRLEQKYGGRLEAIMEKVQEEFPCNIYKGLGGRDVTLWTLADRTIAAKIDSECGVGSKYKTLPDWITTLSKRQASILLEGVIAGDGTAHRSDGWVYYTISKDLADKIQIVALLAGYSAKIWGPYEPTGMHMVRINHPQERLVTKKNITTLPEASHRVVCFTVPNETLVTRRNGKPSFHGNTKYAMSVARLALQGIEYFQDGIIRSPMTDLQIKTLLNMRHGTFSYEYCVAYLRELEDQMHSVIAEGNLPNEPNYERIYYASQEIHQLKWKLNEG